MSEVSESEYKGNPMIVIKSTAEDKFPFQFGVKKAKLVLRSTSKKILRSSWRNTAWLKKARRFLRLLGFDGLPGLVRIVFR